MSINKLATLGLAATMALSCSKEKDETIPQLDSQSANNIVLEMIKETTESVDGTYMYDIVGTTNKGGVLQLTKAIDNEDTLRISSFDDNPLLSIQALVSESVQQGISIKTIFEGDTTELFYNTQIKKICDQEFKKLPVDIDGIQKELTNIQKATNAHKESIQHL